jgi:peptidoglycan/xylan/chitin deacetylase (PgdA/CDA1 family)
MLSRLVRLRTIVANGRPVVSFTFDNLPAEAAAQRAELLERFGGCGTFYTALDAPTPKDIEALDRLLRRGHDIGLLGLGPNETGEVMDRRKAELGRQLKDCFVSSYAYGGGSVSFRQKRATENRFTAARSRLEGVNAGEIDLGLLRSVSLGAGVDARLKRWLTEAASKRGWLILNQSANDGLDPIKAAIEAAIDLGLEILTVRNAVGAIGWPSNSADT